MNGQVDNQSYDVIIVGGGAAGMFAAIEAAKNAHKVLLLEGNKTVGKKIRISGGGRCNFTNKNVTSSNFQSSNPHFVKSALNQYSNDDFIEMVKDYGIEFYEKKKGQLFCKSSSLEIISMLKSSCEKYEVNIKTSQFVIDVNKKEDLFFVKCKNHSKFTASHLIIATGGISMSAIGASDIGYKIAKSFGHKIIETVPALVPFLLKEEDLKIFKEISGVSLNVTVKVNKEKFTDDLLFTHKGLSGPAILQISSFWSQDTPLKINFSPEINIENHLSGEKKRSPKMKIDKYLQLKIPSRLADKLLGILNISLKTPLGELGQKKIKEIGMILNEFEITPQSFEGINKAEVTKGGVCVLDISSKTMESKITSNLYFIGEVLDVTGHLGGFNFQWAWSSGFVAGRSIF